MKASLAHHYLPLCPVSGKRSFTKDDCKRVLKASQSKGSGVRSIYRCKHCDWWHLTSRRRK